MGDLTSYTLTIKIQSIIVLISAYSTDTSILLAGHATGIKTSDTGIVKNSKEVLALRTYF
jgi:hypothetical protein